MSQRLAELRYNLFRRKAERDLYCAVPEDRPVPPFVAGGEWEYHGRIAQDAPPPPGFLVERADAAQRLSGYYVFQSVKD